MFRSDGDRRSFSLTRDITVIGRREDCDLRIPLGEVSRKHCRLVRDGDSLRLEDLGSSNGTYHNGQRVQEAILSAGDSIQVGPLVFVLQVDGIPADDELAPVLAGIEEPHEDELLGDSSPLQPTAQSEFGGGELPTLDDNLEELEPLESLDSSDGLGVASPLAEAGPAEALHEEEPAIEAVPPLGLDAPADDDLDFDKLVESELGSGDDADHHELKLDSEHQPSPHPH
jgi:pSer/pThr/pTyr-binding forkhead associated (FHA) protein